MPSLTPTELPIELIEKIIDEVFFSQFSTSQNTMLDPQTLSSLARVSHIFRQHINSHRFSTVSFQRSDLTPMPLDHIHAFLDLLQSDVWVAPSMGVAPYVRKLVLPLGESINGDTVPHRALEGGSLIKIMNTIFRGGDGYAYSTSNYTLALWGFAGGGGGCINWDAMNSEFISNLENLLDSRIATLELTLLKAVPPTLFKKRHVKHLTLCGIQLTSPQQVSDFRALGPWNHLESLDIYRVPFFDLVGEGDIPMLKNLTVDIKESSMANAISYHWRHWTMLEDLTLKLNNNHILPLFRVDYRQLSKLRRLTIDLMLVTYNNSSTASSMESSMHGILNLLGADLPPLARLEISIDTAFVDLFESEPGVGCANDIPTQIDCAALDAVLAQHLPAAISTICLRFTMRLSRGLDATLTLETFRQNGLDVLREAFPRLNAGPRRRVYDSEMSTKTVSQSWEDGRQMEVLFHTGMFSVAYTAVTP